MPFRRFLASSTLALGLTLAAPAAFATDGGMAGVTDFTATAPNAAQMIDALAPPMQTKGFGTGKSMGTAKSAKDLAVVERRIRLDIPFANRSAELTGDARRTLEELAAALTSPRLATAKIVLEGHANRTGDAAYNRDLTERRAAAAARFLYDRGVTAARLSAAGFGFDRPVPGTDPRDGRNRRVEIVAAP